MSLTADDLQQYQREGFVLIRRLIDADTLARIDARFLALVAGEAGPPESMVIMKDVAFADGEVVPRTPLHAINKIHSFEDDPILFAHSRDDRLLDCVEALIGPGVMSIATNVINKPPGVDGRHPLHQDLTYFPLRPPEWIVGAWTALAPCTRENGCLAVIPGSHLAELHWHGEPDWEHVNSGFFALEDVDLEARVHFEMAPGDTLLVHPLLVHGSGRNRSNGFRRAISTHYASADCERPDQPRKRPPVVKVIPST